MSHLSLVSVRPHPMVSLGDVNKLHVALELLPRLPSRQSISAVKITTRGKQTKTCFLSFYLLLLTRVPFSHCRTEKNNLCFVVVVVVVSPVDFQAAFQGAGRGIQQHLAFSFCGKTQISLLWCHTYYLFPQNSQLLEIPKSGYFPNFSFLFKLLLIYLLSYLIQGLPIHSPGWLRTYLPKPPDSA